MLYQIAYCADTKNSPPQREQKWPETGTYGRNLFGRFQTSDRFPDFPFLIDFPSTLLRGEVRKRVRHMTIHPVDVAAAQKSGRASQHFMCEQKAYLICFWCLHKSYPVKCSERVNWSTQNYFHGTELFF